MPSNNEAESPETLEASKTPEISGEDEANANLPERDSSERIVPTPLPAGPLGRFQASFSLGSLATLIAVAGSVIFIFLQLHPSLLFSGTLEAGGDTGAHVALPAYMKAHLLPHLRLTGWSPEWYDGYPIFTFYFPLPSFIIVIFSYVFSYAVAFKLGTVLGLLVMPVAGWALGKLAGARGPVPACLALGTVPFVFEQSFTIDGGNIASTMAGEYSFALSLALALVAIGLIARGLIPRKHAVLVAVLAVCVLLCHVLPFFFLAIAAGLLLMLNFSWRSLRWAAVAGVTTVGLAAFWLLPFVAYNKYSSSMGWQQVRTFVSSLFPGEANAKTLMYGFYPSHSELTPFLWMALFGAVVSVVLSLWPNAPYKSAHKVGVVLFLTAILSALAFIFAPQSAVYNARALPFWFISVYLLAAIGVGEAGYMVAWLWRRSRVGRYVAWWWTADRGEEPSLDRYPDRRWNPGSVALPIVGVITCLVYVSLPLGLLPQSLAKHLEKPTTKSSFIPGWVDWNLSGYQAKASWPEYHSIVDTMWGFARQNGCGRAMWEYEAQQNRFGTPEALMLLPYWTNGCVDSMEGLLFESSATTPYHFLNQSELSTGPSDAMAGLPYAGLDVPLGIQHLQMLGVKYFMAFSPAVVEQADLDPTLVPLGTSGPWSFTYDGSNLERTWHFYLIKSSTPVVPLSNEPLVVQKNFSQASWQSMAVDWYQDPAAFPVFLTDAGLRSWPHVKLAGQDIAPNLGNLPARGLPPVKVSNIRQTNSSISFDVSRTGVPVLVRISYFPDWHASGAKGPFRATPNLMIVVPTSKHVDLVYGPAGIDLLGDAMTLVTLVVLVGSVIVAWLRRQNSDFASSVSSLPGRLRTFGRA